MEEQVIAPTIKGLRTDGIAYKGFLFRTHQGGRRPFVIEYNCRMGDPETQVIMPRIFSDIIPLYLSVARGDLAEAEFETDPGRQPPWYWPPAAIRAVLRKAWRSPAANTWKTACLPRRYGIR